MRTLRLLVVLSAFLFVISAGSIQAQESASPVQAPQAAPPPVPTQPPAPIERAPASAPQAPPPAGYDKAIFLQTIPPDQLAFMSQFAGARSGDVYKNKDFHRAIKGALPDPMFHYGRDRLLEEAMDLLMDGSPQPVEVHDNRYVVLSGKMDMMLSARAMLWIDMHDGLLLGTFYFHPINGEPTPTLLVFTKQIKQDSIGISELPPAFVSELSLWSQQVGIPAVTIRYFIGNEHKKFLLEHDEDYCAPADGASLDRTECEQMNADAADLDLTAATYLQQVRYATNATAQMMRDPSQLAWIQMRNTSCGIALGCRVTMTRTQVRTITHRSPPPPHPAPGPRR